MNMLTKIERPAFAAPLSSKQIVAATRAVLKAGLRIMINPEGRLETGGYPRDWFGDDDDKLLAAAETCRIFDRMTDDPVACAQIERIVRRLGHNKHGWRVLRPRPNVI